MKLKKNKFSLKPSVQFPPVQPSAHPLSHKPVV